MFDYKRAISISLLGIAICSPVLAVHIVANVSRGIDDAYAQWGAVDMVTDYMDEHEGEWPRDWASLEPYFARGNGRVGGWSFARFQSRVWINFSADAAELRAASLASEKTPFDVIGATSIWASQMGDGPNAMLHRYFRNRGRHYGKAAAPPAG